MLFAWRYQIWVITCLSLPPSLSLSHTAWGCFGAARFCGAVYCAHGSVRRRRLLHSRLGAAAPSIALAPPSIALAAPQALLPTHLFLSFGEMFQWRKSSVCFFGALAPPSIALAPTLPPKICKSDSTKQSFNNF